MARAQPCKRQHSNHHVRTMVTCTSSIMSLAPFTPHCPTHNYTPGAIPLQLSLDLDSDETNGVVLQRDRNRHVLQLLSSRRGQHRQLSPECQRHVGEGRTPFSLQPGCWPPRAPGSRRRLIGHSLFKISSSPICSNGDSGSARDSSLARHKVRCESRRGPGSPPAAPSARARERRI